MTEGPTAKFRAWWVYNQLHGLAIRGISANSKRINVDIDHLIGKVFTGYDTFGKNIVFIFEDYAIRIHLMMYGTIHIYNAGEELKKPSRLIRLDIFLDGKRLVVYNAPIVEIDKWHSIKKKLKEVIGEDPLRKDWNFHRAINLIKKHKDSSIGSVLLDQKVIAGVGNILRNEILFRARVHPDRLVRDLTDDEIIRIVKTSEELMRTWFNMRKSGKRISSIILIYGKSGKPCPVCGNKIKFYRQKPHNRRTYVCEKCQK